MAGRFRQTLTGPRLLPDTARSLRHDGSGIRGRYRDDDGSPPEPSDDAVSDATCLLAVAAVAALTMGCVADTLSVSVVQHSARSHRSRRGPGAGRADRHAATGRHRADRHAATDVRAVPRAGAGAPSRRQGIRRDRARERPDPLLPPRPGAARRTSRTGRRRAKKRFLTYDALPQAFAAQLDWLLANGYTTILPRDLAAHWDTGTPLPVRPVIITFDDGSHDWVNTVLPMLQARGMVAEFYLTLDAVKFGNLTWKEARRLVAAGNGIGAHDVHHVQLTAFGNGHPERVGGDDVDRGQRGAPDHRRPRRRLPRLDGVRRRRVRRDARAPGRGGRLHLGAEHQPRDRPDSAHRYRLRVVRIGAHDDVASLDQGHDRPGLPTFTKRMQGVPDK